MSNLVVRGLGEEGTLVVAGLGFDGTLISKAVSGILTAVGALTAVFLPFTGATDAQKNQGGTSIQIDLGID